jgi:uridine kinase
MSGQSAGSYIVAISGTSGSGKTTLVNAVTQSLGEAVSLHFDDYATVSSYPTDMRAWIDAGADPAEWRTPKLGDDLRAMKSGKPIKAPNGARMDAAPYVVLEEPFGRARPEVAGLIDFVAFVDVPLEIALARRLLRDFDDGAPRQPEGYTRRLYGFLSTYVAVYRDAYAEGIQLARETCDLQVDGMKTVEELAEEITLAARVSRRAMEQLNP